MIFAFSEDGVIEVYATPEDATREYEGVDVEAGLVRFYDAQGVYLEPQFSTPTRRGKLFGLIPWVESTAYRLVPNPGAPEDSFGLSLYEATSLAPNPWFTSLEQLREQMQAQGIATAAPKSG